MRNKRNFNNLFDSICITLLLLVLVVLYLVAVWFGVINSKEGTDLVIAMIAFTIILGIAIAITITLMIKRCYEYWIMSDDSIISKKLFSRKVIIKFSEIERVEKKIVPALVLGLYKSEAYVIYSKSKKIVILTGGRKKFFDLEFELDIFIDEHF
ncbi:MAG: hypothetical protein IJW52_06335 [Clostridia bacterium]|nr:hypothetical protein [Clostridia bacterium]